MSAEGKGLVTEEHYPYLGMEDMCHSDFAVQTPAAHLKSYIVIPEVCHKVFVFSLELSFRQLNWIVC